MTTETELPINELAGALPSNIGDVMAAFTAGEHVDLSFATDIANVEGTLQGLADQLISFDLSGAADKLTSLIGTGSFDNLSSFITDNISSVFDNANLHQTLTSIESALGTVTGACPGLDKAFGPFMGGRSVLSSLDSLKDKIPQLGPLKAQLQAKQAELTQAVADLQQNLITPEQKAAIEGQVANLQSSFNGVKGQIAALTTQVNDVMSDVNGAITQANSFVSTATSKLATFTDALKINALSKDPCMQAVLGSVGSSRVLSLL